MPYYIYKITPPRNLEYLDSRDRFKEAKSRVQQLREENTAKETLVRMIFAKTTGEAEKLLSRVPDGRVIGED